MIGSTPKEYNCMINQIYTIQYEVYGLFYLKKQYVAYY